MVIDHLGKSSSENENLGIAPVSDRVMASLVDASLFWPVFSLLLSSLLRKLQYRYYTAPDSLEFLALLLVVVICYLGLAILTQTLFWSLGGATPGQRFFQIRVLSLRSGRPLSLYAALLRSTLFWVEALFLGVAWLEVFSHPERRTLHDRAVESATFTLKKVELKVPGVLERKLVKNVMTLMISGLLLFVSTQVQFLYNRAEQARFHEAELKEDDQLCADVPTAEGLSRLDTAIALFLGKELSGECLEAEIDFAFWKQSDTELSWASLASALLNQEDPELFGKYLEQACRKASGPACDLSLWLKDKNSKVPSSQSWTRYVLVLNDLMEKNNLNEAAVEIENLPLDFDMPNYLQTKRLSLMARSQKTEQLAGGYAVIYPALLPSYQLSLGQELCSEEVTLRCSSKKSLYCTNFEKSLQTQGKSATERDLVTLAEYKSCRQESGTSVLRLAEAVEPTSALGKMILALISESSLHKGAREDTFRTLLKDTAQSDWLRARAMFHLLKTTNKFDDFQLAKNILSDLKISFREDLDGVFQKSLAKSGFTLRERQPASQEPQ